MRPTSAALAAAGLANLWMAILADMGASLAVTGYRLAMIVSGGLALIWTDAAQGGVQAVPMTFAPRAWAFCEFVVSAAHPLAVEAGVHSYRLGVQAEGKPLAEFKGTLLAAKWQAELGRSASPR